MATMMWKTSRRWRMGRIVKVAKAGRSCLTIEEGEFERFSGAALYW